LCLAMQRSMAQKLGDRCGWDRMLASVVLWVKGGWVVGTGIIMQLWWLGRGPGGNGWGVCCCASIRGRVNCFRGVGESKGVGLLDMVSMLTDKSVMALDMLAIASSRQSAACKTREKDVCSQGVHIVERYGGRGRSRGVGVCCHVVWWCCHCICIVYGHHRFQHHHRCQQGRCCIFVVINDGYCWCQHWQWNGFFVRAGIHCVSVWWDAACRSVAACQRDDLTTIHKRGCHHHGWCCCDCVVVAAGRVRGDRWNKTFAHSVNVIKELVKVISWWWWCKGEVSCQLKLGLGVMVIFIVAVGLCYGCGSVSLSTRVLICKNE